MPDLRERISGLLAEQFKLPEASIVESADLEHDFKATSLDQVELVMRVEDVFEIEISDHEAAQLKTVSDLLALVGGKTRPGASTH